MNLAGKFRSRALGMGVFLFVSASAVCVQADTPLTVRDVALQAVEYDPGVQASWHAYLAAGYERDTARGGYLPSVDLGVSGGREYREYDNRGSYTRTQAQISLTQMLFDGFATRGEVARLKGAQQVRYFELLSSVEQTAFEAVRAYEDVLRHRQLLELAKQNYAQHQSVLRQIEERVTSGVGRRSDLEQVTGRLALAETNLLTEASNLHDVTARYLRVVGQLPAAQLVPSNFRDQSLPGDIREALHLAYQGNPGFHAAIKNISSAQATVSRERSGYLPRLELRARQATARNSDGFDDRFDPNRFGDEGVVELALTYNLYRGGSDRAAVRRALAEVNQAKDLRDQACIDLRQTTQVAFNDSRRIREQLTPLRQHMESSDRVRAAYREQFDIGQRSLLDLLDSENEHFQASRAYVNARGDQAIANARTLAAMGRLLASLDIVRDQVSSLEAAGTHEAPEIRSDAVCPDLTPVALTRSDLVSEVTPLSADTLFRVGSADLSPGALDRLNRLLDDIQAKPNVASIIIAGHTDSTGTDMINLPLSEARASSVRDYLVANGLRGVNIEVEGHGASRPVASNATEQGRAANRRVEIIVTRSRN